jgi:hypothetical protein
MDEALVIIMSGESLPQMDLSQMWGSGYDPMHELMRAMILRAIEDFNYGGELKEEALEYLDSDEEEYILSFRAICRHFGFDPLKTRDAIVYATRRISTRRRAA